jgi:hypothetical protein
LYDTTNLAGGDIAQYELAPSTYADGFLGGPAYSPVTGLLYVDVTSSSSSLYPPGMVAINPGCGTPSVTWQTTFGPDSYPAGVTRSVPAVSAGGVIFVGTPCTPDGNGSCTSSTTTNARSRATFRPSKPAICCAPAGGGRGAVWAISASSGAVLNGGLPLFYTDAPVRAPPTIDGDWIYVVDISGDLYGLTLDTSYPPIQTSTHPVNPRVMKVWEAEPRSRSVPR